MNSSIAGAVRESKVLTERMPPEYGLTVFPKGT